MSKHPSKLRIWEPIVLFVVILAVVYFVVNALNSGSLLWFKSGATRIEPIRIVIVDHGERVTLIPGHADFTRLSEAAAEALATIGSTDLVAVGLSQETLADYDTSGVLLELYFQRPIQFQTRFRAGEPTQILVPIAGRHSGNGYFFRGAEGEWWFGAIRMADPGPLYEVMADLGFQVSARNTAGY
jgi:hypothetical protein